jgi:hypothetical protein
LRTSTNPKKNRLARNMISKHQCFAETETETETETEPETETETETDTHRAISAQRAPRLAENERVGKVDESYILSVCFGMQTYLLSVCFG